MGIGRGIALALAQAGATVAVTHFTHEASDLVAHIEGLGRSVRDFPLDATNRADVDAVVDQAADSLGGTIDVLVNNAGGLVARVSLAQMPDSTGTRSST